MRNKASALTAILAVILISFYFAAFAGEEFKFPAIEDAWVNEDNPAANYGNNSYLSIKDRSKSAEAFIKFGGNGLGALAGKNIVSASLWLYQYACTYSPGDTISAHQVGADWNESEITWDNKPMFQKETISALDLNSGNNQWREWPRLESLVSSWINNGNYGLALENNTDLNNEELFARFYSSEFSDIEKRPYLQVQTADIQPAIEPISASLLIIGGGILGLARLRRR
jgi:hypothetical protein